MIERTTLFHLGTAHNNNLNQHSGTFLHDKKHHFNSYAKIKVIFKSACYL